MEKTITRKATKAQMFASLLEIPGLTIDQIAFIEHEMELLQKKNSSGGSKKLTPQQEENERVKEAIVKMAMAEPNRLFTVTELLTLVAPGFSNQRMAQVVRQLTKPEFGDERLVREEVKRVAYFKLNPAKFDPQEA